MKIRIFIIFVLGIVGCIGAVGETFVQPGRTLLYEGKNSKTPTSIPVRIIIRGTSSTSNDNHGNFSLHLNNAKAGDPLKNVSVEILQSKYIWFNKERVFQWVLTKKKSLPIEICPKKLIDDLSSIYSNNYVKYLKTIYEKEREKARRAIEDAEELKQLLSELRIKYQRDVEEVRLRSIEFAYVDETQLDSLEYELRQCYLTGDIEKAIAIVKKIDLCGTMKDLGENLSKSHSKVLEDASALYRYVVLSDNHLRNLEASGEAKDSLRSFYDNLIPYYEQLVTIYSPANINGLRCSNEFYANLTARYGRLLFDYDANYMYEYTRDIEYDPGILPDRGHKDWYLMRAVSLKDVRALAYLYDKLYYSDPVKSKELNWQLIEELEKRNYPAVYSKIPEFGGNLGNIYEDYERHPSFKLKLGNDSVYFTIIGPGEVSLAKWIRLDKKNRTIKVPEKVKLGDEIYTVTKIGREAMGAQFYADEEMEISDMFDGVVEIKLPETVTYLSSNAIGTRFWVPEKVNVPKSIKILNDFSVEMKSLLDKRLSLQLPNGLEYLGNLQANYQEDEAFNSLFIPASVEAIGCMEYSPRSNTFGIVNLKVDERNRNFMTVDDVLYTKDGSHIFLGSLAEKKKMFIPDSLNLTYTDIDDYMENSYYGHFFIGGQEEIIVSPDNPYMEVCKGTLCNKREGSILLTTDGVLAIPPYATRISSWVANSPIREIIVDPDASPEIVASILLSLYPYDLKRIEIYGEVIELAEESNAGSLFDFQENDITVDNEKFQEFYRIFLEMREEEYQ